MKRIVTGSDNLFGPWIAQQLGFYWFQGRGSTIGLMDMSRGPVACALFEGFNGASVMVHLAAVGKNWVNREFLWFVSYYPFEQLGATKIIAPVESTNLPSIRWTEHFGFSLEATLKSAAPNGDLLLYTITREQCKWLDLKDKYRGKTLSATST